MWEKDLAFTFSFSFYVSTFFGCKHGLTIFTTLLDYLSQACLVLSRYTTKVPVVTGIM